MRYLLLATLAGLLVATMPAHALVVLSTTTFESEVGDAHITCVADPGNPQQVPCHACFGPGETQDLPVERQGEGYAVGVPDSPGFYTELDPVRGMASC